MNICAGEWLTEAVDLFKILQNQIRQLKGETREFCIRSLKEWSNGRQEHGVIAATHFLASDS